MSKVNSKKSDSKRDKIKAFVKGTSDFHDDDIEVTEEGYIGRNSPAPRPKSPSEIATSKREAALDLGSAKAKYSTFSSDSLRELAERHGIDNYEDMSRDEIIAAIEKQAS